MMKKRCAFKAVLGALLFLQLSSGAPGAEPVKQETAKTGPGAMVIHSQSLELNDNAKVVTFSGDVRATRDDFTIECQKMQVHYAQLPGQKGGVEAGRGIDRIEASGKVRIVRAEGGTASAEQAVYHQAEEKVVLTGSPMVKQGNDFVEGDRITLFLKENRSVVESEQNRKVRAVIYPRGQKQ